VNAQHAKLGRLVRVATGGERRNDEDKKDRIELGSPMLCFVLKRAKNAGA
jgi:hypothetical protein